MRRPLLPLGWMLAAAGGCLAGCQHAAPAIPADPIFVSKKPLLSRPEVKPPEVLACLEPELPCAPPPSSAIVPVQYTASSPKP